jgi:hypothetical protein
VVRLVRWVGWSVAVSLLPFAGLQLMRFVAGGTWPGLDPLFGSGQLLLTSVAILAGGVRELAGMRGSRWRGARTFLLWSSLALTIVLAMLYGFLADAAITQTPTAPSRLTLVTATSLVFFGASLAVAGTSIVASTPEEPVHA